MIEPFIRPENMLQSGLKAFFTTKALRGRLSRIARELGIPRSAIYMPTQRHTDRVHVLKDPSGPVIADAVITDLRNILIGVAVADCVSILLYDSRHGVIGAVHAGWRGTAMGILKGTVRTMAETFSTIPEDILIAIGPSIRGCCYEVSRDVMDVVIRQTGPGSTKEYCIQRDGRLYLDIAAANMAQAISIGIRPKNIWLSGECTFCNPDRFYSYRYSGNKNTGRQGGFIGMW